MLHAACLHLCRASWRLLELCPGHRRASDGEHAAVQHVSDGMWAQRGKRFPEHTPSTREYYLLRSIFEEHFPSPQALATVPFVRPCHARPMLRASDPALVCQGFAAAASLLQRETLSVQQLELSAVGCCCMEDARAPCPLPAHA